MQDENPGKRNGRSNGEKPQPRRRTPHSLKPAIRVLIADDQALFRDGLRKLLDSEKDLCVVGEAASSEGAVALARQLTPDVLVVSLTMRGDSGLGAVRELSAGAIRIIVLAGDIDRSRVLEAFRLGARGFVHKESGTPLLLAAIHAVVLGHYWLEDGSETEFGSALRRLLSSRYVSAENGFGLTVRELEIVWAIVAGDTNKEIAQKLSLGERTVKQHLTNIFGKLGVATRLELALFAVNRRLMDGQQG